MPKKSTVKSDNKNDSPIKKEVVSKKEVVEKIPNKKKTKVVKKKINTSSDSENENQKTKLNTSENTNKKLTKKKIISKKEDTESDSDISIKKSSINKVNTEKFKKTYSSSDSDSTTESDSDISIKKSPINKVNTEKYKKTYSSSDSDSTTDSDSDNYLSKYKKRTYVPSDSSDSSSDSSDSESARRIELLKKKIEEDKKRKLMENPELIKETNYYKILGVEKDATVEEIRKSYKLLASQWHPDKFVLQAEDKRRLAEANFKTISEAKEVLTDIQKREIYDRDGKSGLENMTGKTDKQIRFMRKMQMIFRKMQKDDAIPDVECTQDVTLEDLYNGKEFKKTIERYKLCPECEGNGTKDKQKHDCERCNGSGKTINRNSCEGICGDCYGYGFSVDKCKECSGRKHVKEDCEIKFTVPRGAYHRCVLTVKDEGNDVLLEHQDGDYKKTDVLVYLREEEHPVFKRGWRIKKYHKDITDADLLVKLKVDIAEVITGLNKKITLIDGEEITIVSNYYVRAGDIMMIPNKGMYKYEAEDEFSSIRIDSDSEDEIKKPKKKQVERGNLYIKFVITYPNMMFNNKDKKKIWVALKGTIPYNDPDKAKNVEYLKSIKKDDFFSDYYGEDKTDNEIDEHEYKEKTAFQNKLRMGFRYPGGFPNVRGSNGHPWLKSRYKHLIH